MHRSAFQERDGFYGQRMLKGERGKKSRNLIQPEPTSRGGCPSQRRGPVELREGLRASAWDHPHPEAPGALGTRDGHANPGKQNPLLTILCPASESRATLLLQPAVCPTSALVNLGRLNAKLVPSENRVRPLILTEL